VYLHPHDQPVPICAGQSLHGLTDFSEAESTFYLCPCQIWFWQVYTLNKGFSGLRCHLFHKFHIAAGHQLFDIHQDQHALVHGAQPLQVTGVQAGAELGRRLDLIGLERDHVGHPVPALGPVGLTVAGAGGCG